MGGGGHVAINGEVVEEGTHVVGAELAWMGGVVEADVAPDPLGVRALGVQAVLATPARATDAVKEFGGLSCGGGHETQRALRRSYLQKRKLILNMSNR